MSKLIIVVASMGMIGFLFLGLTWGEGLLIKNGYQDLII